MTPDTKLRFDQALLPDGWSRNVTVTVRDGLIANIAVGSQAETSTERHAIGIPGMNNVHSHVFQRAMAGMAERRASADNFWGWRDQAYRIAARTDPDSLRAVAALAQIEMLECGFTRVGEFHYLHHDRDGRPYSDLANMSRALFDAAAESGIALTHLPVFYAHSDFGGAPPEFGQRRFVCDLDTYADLLDACVSGAADLPDALVGIAPHSLRAVTPGELHRLIDLAGDRPIHIHIAEQLREVERCRETTGTSPVRWLFENFPVTSNWCLVHATHIDPEEVAAIARSKAVVGLCPITEANLGDGIFPAKDFIFAGGRYAIGTDSNVLIDMPEEMRLLEYAQRLATRTRSALATKDHTSVGRSIFESALYGGAQALGTLSGLTVGAAADIVSLDGNSLYVLGRNDDFLLDSLLFSAGSKIIDCVWRNGIRVVSNGVHAKRQIIEEGFRKILPRLME